MPSDKKANPRSPIPSRPGIQWVVKSTEISPSKRRPPLSRESGHQALGRSPDFRIYRLAPSHHAAVAPCKPYPVTVADPWPISPRGHGSSLFSPAELTAGAPNAASLCYHKASNTASVGTLFAFAKFHRFSPSLFKRRRTRCNRARTQRSRFALGLLSPPKLFGFNNATMQPASPWSNTPRILSGRNRERGRRTGISPEARFRDERIRTPGKPTRLRRLS